MLDNIHLLIVEGTAGVGKSTLIQKLVRQYSKNDAFARRSFLHLAQTHTYSPLISHEDAGTLKVRENLAHLQNILHQLQWCVETAKKALKNGNSYAKFYGIIETFHITQCFRPGIIGLSDVSNIDIALSNIGCKTLFLRASDTTIWERGIESRRNTDYIQNYARKFGSNLKDIHHYFCQEQSRMLELVKKSIIPYKIFNVEDDQLVEKAFKYWIR